MVMQVDKLVVGHWDDTSMISTDEMDGNIGPMDFKDLLSRALAEGCYGIAKTMIDLGSTVSSCHLALAIRAGHGDLVQIMMKAGADVNGEILIKSTDVRWTPLNIAVQEGQLECARLLLEAGAEVDLKSGASGWTPLQRAAYLRQNDMAKLLVEHGADPNVRTTEGWSAVERIRNKSTGTYIMLKQIESFRWSVVLK